MGLISTQERALRFLVELGGAGTKKRIAKHASEHDPEDVLANPKNVGRAMCKLHKSGLVDYTDKSGSKERIWKVTNS